MSFLKPGTRCVIIGGCPENIGLIVEVIEHIGPYEERADAYYIKMISGRFFAQLWGDDNILNRGTSFECVTDRHKLRPLVDPKDESELRDSDVELDKEKKLVIHQS
jgi:hypothetical protein